MTLSEQLGFSFLILIYHFSVIGSLLYVKVAVCQRLISHRIDLSYDVTIYHGVVSQCLETASSIVKASPLTGCRVTTKPAKNWLLAENRLQKMPINGDGKDKN